MSFLGWQTGISITKTKEKIADEGMKWAHEQFNCVKIAGYFLDLIEKGSYDAPWTIIL